MYRYESKHPEHTPYELSTDYQLFINSYADHCGIVSIDELLRLYVQQFGDPGIDYGTLRNAAASRTLACGGASGVWEHDGVEYAPSLSLSDAGYVEWYRHYLERHYWGELEPCGEEEPPGLPGHVGALCERLVENHEAHPVRELTLEQLMHGRTQRINSSPGVARLVDELLKVRMRRQDRPKKRATERSIIVSRVSSRMLLATTLIDVGNSRAYEDAQYLMTYTFPRGSRDFDLLRDEPDPKVLLAAEVAYRELPLWGLNGWSQNEVRQQELVGVWGETRPRRDDGRPGETGGAHETECAYDDRFASESHYAFDDIPL